MTIYKLNYNKNEQLVNVANVKDVQKETDKIEDVSKYRPDLFIIWFSIVMSFTVLFTMSVTLCNKIQKNKHWSKTSQLPLNKVLSCYYNTPNQDQSYQLMPDNLNPYLCTHINIAFAKVFDNQIQLNSNQIAAIKEVVKLRSINKDLKILLSIGGAGNDNGFSEMVVDHASRKLFIKSIKNILHNLTLDGIDLDWEFPAIHSHKENLKSRERQHFSQLLHEIRAEYIREKRNYLLTVAIAAPESIVDISYDVDQINLYVDFANIMTYDFHSFTQLTPFTGLNSPLYARPNETIFFAHLNINSTVNMYIEKGLQTHKIVVGIPTYGHTFTLVNTDNAEIGSPASGFGSLGSHGFINYPDICHFVKNYKSEITFKEDKDAKVPFLYRNHEWISYDSPQSVIDKVQYIKSKNLRGAMIYSLNADDYENVCLGKLSNNETFPLIHSVKKTLFNEVHA